MERGRTLPWQLCSRKTRYFGKNLSSLWCSSGLVATSFCFVSTVLREISVQEKPVWEKTFEFLGEVVRSLPVFWEFREISASFVDGYSGKTRFGEKPFCCEENPWFFREKTSLWRLVCFLSGACPGGWPLLRLRCAVNSGKNPP